MPCPSGLPGDVCGAGAGAGRLGAGSGGGSARSVGSQRCIGNLLSVAGRLARFVWQCRASLCGQRGTHGRPAGPAPRRRPETGVIAHTGTHRCAVSPLHPRALRCRPSGDESVVGLGVTSAAQNAQSVPNANSAEPLRHVSAPQPPSGEARWRCQRETDDELLGVSAPVGVGGGGQGRPVPLRKRQNPPYRPSRQRVRARADPPSDVELLEADKRRSPSVVEDRSDNPRVPQAIKTACRVNASALAPSRARRGALPSGGVPSGAGLRSARSPPSKPPPSSTPRPGPAQPPTRALRLPISLRRRAFSRMNPAASFWS
ncbi:hypothetical protein SAMN05444276_102664 [Paracoccus sanguinis]|uniref:Uncharacterized protein n=1 Tax=Paracoccus sanguinis TaxID=1545044 RepID=A0A1H2XXH9_9RHOB|nr:hypothetical protein SAMN05444276_102664 [Paracoccus sanguinis]